MVVLLPLPHRQPLPAQSPTPPPRPSGLPSPLWPNLTPDQRRLIASLLADLLRRRLTIPPTGEEVPDA
jgi:hypothetical protein